jgi:hypothetical protein
MAMVGGSASITAHNDGTYTVSGTGLAQALATSRIATQSAVWTGVAASQPGGVLPANLLAAWQAICNQIASDAGGDGAAIVGYIQANAALTGNAVISPTLGGLQTSTASGSLTNPIGGIIDATIPLSGGVT